MEAKFIRVGSVEDIQKKGVVVVHGVDRPIAVFAHDGTVSACDNRCPHLGFPLDKGTVKDGILTCHWHQARFDVCSGCTFDLWADDVPSYETRIEDGAVFVSVSPRIKTDSAYYLKRLQKGMDQNIGLLQAKSLIGLLKLGIGPVDVTREIARYAVRNQDAPGGITELAIAGNIHSVLSQETTYHLLFRGSRRIAETARNSKRQMREGLTGESYEFSTLKSWFYKWVQGRDREGSERVLLTAIESGCSPAQLGDMIFGAISNRVYCDQGHTFDFANKAFELLDLIGWKHAADLLPLALPGIVSGRGAEEQASWHHPIEIIEPLLAAERELPRILRESQGKSWRDDGKLVSILLGDDPIQIIDAMKAALAAGAPPIEVSKRVTYAAAMRLARFAKANEVGDWFNPQHTFTYANAVHHAIKRSPTPDVVRAAFHAALSVYMDRFLNVPPAKLPSEGKALDTLPSDAKALRELLLKELNEQSRIDDAARVVSRYMQLKHPIEALFDTLAFATVREDLDFHTLQVLEAGIQQYREWQGHPEAEHIIVGVARDLAAVCPTPRARLRTAVTALKLHHGEKIYEEDEA
jgi:nitrite reductase/ring-hydroxylating ferredoxin subunit